MLLSKIIALLQGKGPLFLISMAYTRSESKPRAVDTVATRRREILTLFQCPSNSLRLETGPLSEEKIHTLSAGIRALLSRNKGNRRKK
jgi:hypothetical protein